MGYHEGDLLLWAQGAFVHQGAHFLRHPRDPSVDLPTLLGKERLLCRVPREPSQLIAARTERLCNGQWSSKTLGDAMSTVKEGSC